MTYALAVNSRRNLSFMLYGVVPVPKMFGGVALWFFKNVPLLFQVWLSLFLSYLTSWMMVF